MSEVEALCGVGGETHVRHERWQIEDGHELLWSNVPAPEGVTLRKGMCVRPGGCELRDKCTGKVVFSTSVDNGFAKAIITQLIPTNVEEFEEIITS